MNTTAWLLDSDPAVRWQVMRDLVDLPESEWGPERARVETEGQGAIASGRWHTWSRTIQACLSR